jgi:hypothetical protein
MALSGTSGAGSLPYAIYPEVNETRPDLPSPFTDQDHHEFVVAVTKDNRFAVIPVTLGDDRGICKQLAVDSTDFPALAGTGLHSESDLQKLKAITGRPLGEITELGRPGGLSEGGFMAADETILSVIRGDNELVRRMGLTHPELARPLFHVLNMMDTDLQLERWNMARHRWENIKYFFYNDRKVMVDVNDTKGGQKSIFDDGIEGGFHIKLWREPEPGEGKLLQEKYGHLPPAEFEQFVQRLSFINSGEMQPQYIMRYGFYEGHTFWRADPVAIAFIFGLKTLPEIEAAFPGQLQRIMTAHFTE